MSVFNGKLSNFKTERPQVQTVECRQASPNGQSANPSRSSEGKMGPSQDCVYILQMGVSINTHRQWKVLVVSTQRDWSRTPGCGQEHTEGGRVQWGHSGAVEEICLGDRARAYHQCWSKKGKSRVKEMGRSGVKTSVCPGQLIAMASSLLSLASSPRLGCWLPESDLLLASGHRSWTLTGGRCPCCCISYRATCQTAGAATRRESQCRRGNDAHSLTIINIYMQRLPLNNIALFEGHEWFAKAISEVAVEMKTGKGLYELLLCSSTFFFSENVLPGNSRHKCICLGMLTWMQC